MKEGRSLSIGFVTCHFPPDSIGGAQVQSLKLCRALAAKNNVTVFARDYSGSAPRRDSEGGFKLQRRRAIGLPIVRTIVDVSRALREIRDSCASTDIYLSFQIQLAAFIVVVARMRYGIIAAVSPRGEEDFDFHWYKAAFQKFIYRNCSAILIQSESILENFSRSIRDALTSEAADSVLRKVKIVPNGIDLADGQRNSVSSNAREILFVGRLAPIKGIEHLLEALRMYANPYRLTIVGDGPDRKRLESLSIDMPIEFVGMKPFEAIGEYLVKSHVLVLPSLSENLPNVLLEALAHGVPVIASRVGAIPEIVRDGENGYLVEPRNPNSLRRALENVFTTPIHYKTISDGALASAQSFSWKSILPYIQSQLESICTETVQ